MPPPHLSGEAVLYKTYFIALGGWTLNVRFWGATRACLRAWMRACMRAWMRVRTWLFHDIPTHLLCACACRSHHLHSLGCATKGAAVGAVRGKLAGSAADLLTTA